MVIKSIKTGREEHVTAEMWAKLEEIDTSRNFTIISHEQYIPFSGKIEIPSEVRSFMDEKPLTKRDIMEELKEKGIDYKPQMTKQQLVEKLNDGREDTIELPIDEAV